MKNKMQNPVISDVGFDEAMTADSVPAQDTIGTESPKTTTASRLKAMLSAIRTGLLGETTDAGYAARVHTVRKTVKRCLSVLAVFFLSLFLSGAVLAYETRPLGLAFVCAAGTPMAVLASSLGLLFSGGEASTLYLGGMMTAIGMRYAVGRFLTPDPDAFGSAHSRKRKRAGRSPSRADAGSAGGASLARLGRALFPSGVFSQSIAARASAFPCLRHLRLPSDICSEIRHPGCQILRHRRSADSF